MSSERLGELRHKNARLQQRIGDLTEQLVKIKGELHQALARADSLSTIDPETGLLHWRAFEERALNEIARANRHEREIGLTILAPDGPGQLAGLAEIARSQHRAFDLSGRTENGEVIILLPETSLHGALVVAERIRSLEAKRHGTSASGGCAAWPAHGRALARLVEVARLALSTAREQGGNRVLGPLALSAALGRSSTYR